MSIAEAPARPARSGRWPEPRSARQQDPPEGPDIPDLPAPPEPLTVPEIPGEPEPDPAGVPGERMHGYVFEGYYYSTS